MEYRRKTQGEVECGFRCEALECSLTSSSFCAVTRRNIAAAPPFPPRPTALNDRAAVGPWHSSARSEMVALRGRFPAGIQFGRQHFPLLLPRAQEFL
jgi:hypothetical protein